MNPPPEIRRTDRFDLQALYETSRLLSASLDLNFVIENLLLTAMSKLLVMRGAVLLCQPAKGACRVAAAKGRLDLAPGDTLDVGAAPDEEVLEGAALPAALAAHGFALALPVAHSHRSIGWLALGKKATGQPFAPAEMKFVRSLVHMSSAAVHNALLVEELQEANRDLDARVQELNTLFDLSQEFNAAVERPQLARLLSFALMGQMMVRKHLFLLRRPGATDGEDARAMQDAFEVVTSKGLGEAELRSHVTSALCDLEALVRFDEAESDGAGDKPAWAALREQGFALALPIRQQDVTCAVLCLGPKMSGQPYNASDVEFLYSLGNLAYVSIQNSYLVEEQIEKERLEKEIRLAREIQQRLLPRALPDVGGLDLAAANRPSREVGGDYYDAIPLEGGRLLLAIADVTGKGVPASLLMANLQAALHVLIPVDLTLEEATARINHVVCDNTDPATFITFFHGIYHPDDRRFTYVNAGHNPPLRVRPGGQVEALEEGGLLLGVMRGASYQCGTLALETGDVVVLFTDGVTEAMSAADEEYGEDRLEACLKKHRDASAQAILDAVREEIRVFTGDPEFLSDDLTMIVLKVAS